MLIDTNAESVVRTLKSEKQQAECTAARAAPIVFPRGRPFGAPAGTYSRPVDTPTPRRGAGGNEGKRVPSGHNRRRRLATRSSGKQQAERTAVRAASIVCPEESPLLASINDNFAVSNSPWRGLTRRYRREGRACSPMGRSIVRVAIRRGLGRAESPQCARRRNPQPPVGIDAPTPARIGTCRPKGRSHFSFGGERKVCKRKPAARRLREKGFYCPF